MSTKSKKVHDFFDKTDNYLLNSFPTIFLRRLIINEMLPDIDNSEILDIGCGNGMITIPYLDNNSVTFLDLSKNMLDVAKQNIPKEQIDKATFFNTDIENFISRKKYRIIFLIGVLAHVNDVENAISTISKLTEANGICIVQITDFDKALAKFLNLYSKVKRRIMMQDHLYQTNIMNRRTIVNLFLKNGYEMADEQRYLPSLPGFRMISQKTKSKYLLRTYNTNMASNFGSELILKFKKTA